MDSDPKALQPKPLIEQRLGLAQFATGRGLRVQRDRVGIGSCRPIREAVLLLQVVEDTVGCAVPAPTYETASLIALEPRTVDVDRSRRRGWRGSGCCLVQQSWPDRRLSCELQGAARSGSTANVGEWR